MYVRRITTAVSCAVSLAACSAQPNQLTSNTPVDTTLATKKPATEVSPIDLEIVGPLAEPDEEISALAWRGDELVLLPQYPARTTKDAPGRVFVLPRSTLQAVVDGQDSEPLEPREKPFVAPGLAEKIDGFEGFEALVFDTLNTFWVTIEAERDDGAIAFAARGTVDDDGAMTLVPESIEKIPSEVRIENFSYETLVLDRTGAVVAIHEANTARQSAAPAAWRFRRDAPAERLNMPVVEYRITDATYTDSEGRFWVLNYLYEGERQHFAEHDVLTQRYALGVTHDKKGWVERLVELKLTDNGIELVDRPPVYLELGEGGNNWEGVARLGRGLLIATDKFPGTRLAYAELPP